MPIVYRKLRELCKKRGITSYTMKRYKIIGQTAWKSIQEDSSVNTDTIAAMCKLLDCQPGDIMEYIPDENKTE